MKSLDERLWSIKSIWRAGWRLSLSCRIILPPKENYICLTANDYIFIAISAYPFILCSVPSDSSLYLQTYHIVALCACVWGVHVCEEEEGVKYQVYHECVPCILRSRPLNADALRWSFSLCHSVYPDKSDILFLCFPTTISVVITVCKGRICWCKYAALTERFPLVWLHSPSTYNFGH